MIRGADYCYAGITYSANRMVELLNAKAMVVFAISGGTAKMVASPKPMVPVFVFTPSLHRARLLNLIRGTVPFIVEEDKHLLLHMEQLIIMFKKKGSGCYYYRDSGRHPKPDQYYSGGRGSIKALLFRREKLILIYPAIF